MPPRDLPVHGVRRSAHARQIQHHQPWARRVHTVRAPSALVRVRGCVRWVDLNGTVIALSQAAITLPRLPRPSTTNALLQVPSSACLQCR